MEDFDAQTEALSIAQSCLEEANSFIRDREYTDEQEEQIKEILSSMRLESAFIIPCDKCGINIGLFSRYGDLCRECWHIYEQVKQWLKRKEEKNAEKQNK